MDSVSRLVATEKRKRESLEPGKLLVHKGIWEHVNRDFALQVTIVSPDPGTASGKIAGTQGDMEKADMVDGALTQRDGILPLSAHQCPIQYFPAQLL